MWKKRNITSLFVVDTNHYYDKQFAERFANPHKYVIRYFTSLNGLLTFLEEIRFPANALRICILVYRMDKEIEVQQLKDLDMVTKIRKSDPATEIVIVTDGENETFITNPIGQQSVTVIPKNDNTVLRIYNQVLDLISLYTLRYKRKQWMAWLRYFIFYLLFVTIFFLVLYMYFPDFL